MVIRLLEIQLTMPYQTTKEWNMQLCQMMKTPTMR